MNNKRSKKRLFINLMILAAFLMIAAYLTVDRAPSGVLEVSFIDVGQGDSSLIKTPGGSSLLIDGGEGEQYRKSVAPFLYSDSIWKVDAVMASHYHSDHAGGIVKLLAAGKAKTLLIPDVDKDRDLKKELQNTAKSHSISVVPVNAGKRILLDDENVKLNVLFPSTKLFKNNDDNLNNDSIVLRLDYYGLSFLFTGDLESNAEQVLVNSGKLDTDVLKVGHHGSSTSSSAEFLDAVTPDYAIIEAGLHNKYNHPHREVMQRLKERNIRIFRTDKNGNITFYADKNGIKDILVSKTTTGSN